jgi:hypothetical protein
MHLGSKPEGGPISNFESKVFVAMMVLGALIVIAADQRADSPLLVLAPSLKLVAEAVIGAGIGGFFWVMGCDLKHKPR